MKRHVSLVLLPIDDYTNEVIKGNYIKPWIEWEHAPIWKQGFYIFTDMKQEKVLLHVDSQLYQNQTISISLDTSSARVIKLRLVPSEKYAMGNNSVVIRGIGEVGQKAAFYSEEIRQCYKLLKDYEPGTKISIFHPNGLDLSGKTVWLKGREKRYLATLGEQQEDEENCYEITRVPEKLRKAETDIYLVYETVVREDGTFYLLFPQSKEIEFHGIMEYQKISQPIVLRAGEENFFLLSQQELD